MARLIVAMYADRGGAEGALQQLLTAGIARDRIGLIGATHRPGTELAPARDAPRGGAEARLHDLPLHPDDISFFEAGLREHRVLLTARVEEANLDRARDILDLFDPVDLEHGGLASSGGTAAGGASSGTGMGVDVGGPLGAGLSGGGLGGATNTAAVPGMNAMADALDATGTADLRTGDASLTDMGSSTRPTSGDRRAEERAGAPGVRELYRRDPSRRGRVRVFSRES